MHLKYLALGDSYTIGEGVAAADRWPVQMVARLRHAGIAVADPAILARTGWTTDELAAAMDTANLDPPFALVTLLIGVNNQYRGRPRDDYRQQFRALLWRAIGLVQGSARRVVAVSIPDWGVTPFAAREGRDPAVIARGIDSFNAVARDEAAAVGAHWADVTMLSRAPESRAAVVADGLHPSAAQYARWVDATYPFAHAVLMQD